MSKVINLVLLLIVSISSSSGTFDIIPGGLKHVSGSVNYLWGVNTADNIYRCDRPCTGNWVRVAGGLKQIDVGDDEVWGVNSADNIYKRPADGSGSWQRIPGGLKHVSASGNGYIWGVNSADQIYKCKKPCSGSWVRVSGGLKQIDGGHKYVYGVNSANNMYSRPVDGSGSWRLIPGLRAIHVTASGTDDIFAISTNQEIYRCKKPCIGEFEKMVGSLMQCDATINGLFGVNSRFQIYKHTIGV